MAEVSMIRKPEVECRERGVRRWSVTWSLFNHDAGRSSTRRKLFFTQRGAERWIESKRVRPAGEWRPVSSPGLTTGAES